MYTPFRYMEVFNYLTCYRIKIRVSMHTVLSTVVHPEKIPHTFPSNLLCNVHVQTTTKQHAHIRIHCGDYYTLSDIVML